MRPTRLACVFSLAVVMWVEPSLAQTETPMRGVLTSPGGELPFVMSEILGPYRIYHGVESAAVRWRRTGQTVTLEFPPYDSRIEATSAHVDLGLGSGLSGTWSKVGPAGVVTMPFRWEQWPMVEVEGDPSGAANGPLFPLSGQPLDVSGRWRVKFEHDAQPAVGIFEANRGKWSQVPGEIQGTFLTVTGDYRYLAGTARGDEMRLACFDGAHAFLFAAKLQGDGTLRGDFWSGAAWHETWTAQRDDKAALPDAFSLTKARDGSKIADLAYPDAADADAAPRRVGELLGNVTLVVLFGTWCPNCGDAGPFLEDLLARYGERGLRVLGLAFEHGDDRARQLAVVAAYRELHEVKWPILLAGSSDKSRASAAFPVLDAVRSFPTTLFVDAEGNVRSVHQGFAGPATGEAHTAQKAAFEQLVVRLLHEAKGGR